MNAQQWMVAAFAAVACGGLLMALRATFGHWGPTWLRNGHGLGGLAALIALFAMNLHGEAATPIRSWWAFGVLLSGFIGGLLLLRVLFRSKAPLWVVFLHGAIGITGIALLYSTLRV
ncbi:hypothetical protein [Paraburkholderia ferrariae]|uniref:hypothetical protein n=1 Tax=Paraburkholderia ferrariae TaxID=386056 RepID=UPI0012EBA1BD|nr:hypothetical protein [Paraburkholderia ferrariae]